MFTDDTPPYSVPNYATNVYAALPHADSLRVLVLNPAEDNGANIRCEIVPTRLCNCVDVETSYVALSYVWGSLEGPRVIFIGDEVIHIGRNLADALRHLRRRAEPLRLWTDALCINQFDISERSHQVQQMRDIYSCALETVIYLGSDDGGNTTLSAWNYLERNSEWARNKEGEQDDDLPQIMEVSLVGFRGDLSDVEISVLSRPWFLRVWVLQEVVVSKNVSIQCGSRRVPWENFCRILLSNSRSHDRFGQSPEATTTVDIVRDMYQARCAYQEAQDEEYTPPFWHTSVINSGGASTHIIHMLNRALKLQASDPRDKVFALLGISTDIDVNHDLIAVNYEKPTVQVFADFARYMIESTKSFDVLSYVNHTVSIWASLTGSSSKEKLPSWAPDWDGSLSARESKMEKPSAAELSAHLLSTIIYGVGPLFLTTLKHESMGENSKRQHIVGKSITWLNNSQQPTVVSSKIGLVTNGGVTVRLQGQDETSFQSIRDLHKLESRGMRKAIMRRWKSLFIQHIRGNWNRGHLNPEELIGPLMPMEEALNLMHDDPGVGSATIESHLVARGRQTAAWAGDNWVTNRPVIDKTSVVEGKCIGTYSDSKTSNGQDRLVILPPGAVREDWIVYFHGARVPFVVRPMTEGFSGLRQPRADGGQEFSQVPDSATSWANALVQCKLVGECFINEFDEFTSRNEHDWMAMRID